ncbi:hypothetical protein E6C48_21400 [Mesorhizobium composti]|uniref:Glucosamine inositolphosphorylceramide transferase 1 N-terminal domain-containing protein n=2 Tax=Ollibium composti TaxID=2675109 RepID=A0ABY2Q177_9HYPH|nr:hypothetical protein E6C48_21400 [Mesorhizobium composti]
MAVVDVIVPASRPRLWQRVLVERLRACGHDVAVLHQSADPWPAAALQILRFERRLFRRRAVGLATPVEAITQVQTQRPADLRLDLTGVAPPSPAPTVRLTFDGRFSDFAAVSAVAAGRLPDLQAVLADGTVVGRAAPMIDKREATALGIEDVLARAVTLALSVVARFDGGWADERQKIAPATGGAGGSGFVGRYVTSALPRLGREALRRARFRHAHWRVGYRFIDGPGVAETGMLGDGWRQLPDDGTHFYADPFPYAWRQGEHLIFVEDYPHATGKAIISLVRIGADGAVRGPVEPVLEEPFHLSYPQVFDWQGDVWMLPEGSASGRLTLYRAARFPDRWVAEAVLLEGKISDATLFQQDGSWWLFATDRDGYGSTSDTMVVFRAPSPAGPWRPHRMNPIVIDRAMARPGGAFATVDGRPLLPVQDGTEGYGGGLGLSELLELDENTVRLAPPRPVSGRGDWPYPRIHTLNRAGRLEVIDGIAAVRRR